MNWSTIVWFVLLIILVLAEASTVMVVSLWFAAGALVAMITSMLGGPLWLQILLFIAVSGTLLYTLRPVLKKFFTPKLTRTNVDAVIGEEGITMVAVDNLMAQGKVKLNGMEWSARSTSGENIPENVKVRIDRVEGVKLYVTPVEVTVQK